MKVPLVLWFLLLSGCPKRATAPESLPPALPSPPAPPATGTLTDGVYQDGSEGFSLAIPGGWQPTVGTGTGPLRLSLRDPATGATLEVYALHGFLMVPNHADCTWRFEDIGHYEGNEVPSGRAWEDKTLVGDCTPVRTGAPRRMASCKQRNEVTLCVEAELPSGTLGQFHGMAGEMLGQMRMAGAAP